MAIENEELLDYEDEADVLNGSITAPANGAAAYKEGAQGDEKEKKGFAGIHSTGFRCVYSLELWDSEDLKTD
jgi:hypothetical protein